MSRLRVLHAPIVALYQPWLMAQGLRAAGCAADYMCLNFRSHEQWLAHSADFDLGLDGTRGTTVDETIERDFLEYALDSYDVFHFHSGYTLLRGNGPHQRCSDLGLLKRLGKRIVMHWWGCDRRTESLDGHLPYSACHECEPHIRSYCRTPAKAAPFRWVDELTDLQLSAGDLCASLPHVKWISNAIDTDLWRPMARAEIPEEHRLPPSDALRVYHSFGNSALRGDVKGTREIRAAVEQLAAEGHAIEFMFFDRVPNLQLRFYQAQADIVVDQLRAGWYGSTAVECMACAKPVITYIRPEVAAIAPPDHPLVHATLETIYDVLKGLVLDPARRASIGAASREYVLREHSHLVVGRRLKELYEAL